MGQTVNQKPGNICFEKARVNKIMQPATDSNNHIKATALFLPMMTENPKINTILKLGEPKTIDWLNYIEKYGFNHEDVAELIEVLTSEELNNFEAEQAEVWAPLHAWRILAQLKSEQAIEPLIRCFDFLCHDDWALSDIEEVFALIGPAAIPQLAEYFQRAIADPFAHIMALDALAAIAGQYPEHRNRIIKLFQQYMSAPDESAYELNGLLIGRLINLDATEAIEQIRHLFELSCVDIGCAGDLEEVEIQLGFRSKRSTPRPNYAELHGLDADDFVLDHHDRYSAHETYVRASPKIGRNDPCPCNSGKKYKKCCGSN